MATCEKLSKCSFYQGKMSMDSDMSDMAKSIVEKNKK